MAAHRIEKQVQTECRASFLRHWSHGLRADSSLEDTLHYWAAEPLALLGVGERSCILPYISRLKWLFHQWSLFPLCGRIFNVIPCLVTPVGNSDQAEQT